MIKIFNEDCFKTMEAMEPVSVQTIMTSPPYNSSNRGGKGSKTNLTNMNINENYYPSLRYDVFLDNKTPEEYIEWSVKLFNSFDRILTKDGCIAYNISYSSTDRDTMFRVISHIIEETNFSLADMIVWKKSMALPNNTSPNKLTRIIEPVFIFARKKEMDTFFCNKKVTSVREKTGQKMYENVYNFVEAKNNDGSCKLNKATYSTDLCSYILGLYGKPLTTCYDPFFGTGTTGNACIPLGIDCIGSEISEAQCEYARDRLFKTMHNVEVIKPTAITDSVVQY